MRTSPARALRATTLRRIFKSLIVTSIAVPASVVPFVACKGGPGDISENDQNGGSRNGGASEGSQTSDPQSRGQSSGECRAAEAPDAPACGKYKVKLAGDDDTCGFGADGGGTDAFCTRVCGQSDVQCQRAGDDHVECSKPCAADGGTS